MQSRPHVSSINRKTLKTKTNRLNRLVTATILVAGLSVYSCNDREDFVNDVAPKMNTALENTEIIATTATITVDENAVIKDAGKYMLGFNHAWGATGR